MDGNKLRCPCNHKKCRNRAFLDIDTIKLHLCKNGFVENYYEWIHHGEPRVSSGSGHSIPVSLEGQPYQFQYGNQCNDMVIDASRVECHWDNMEESPNVAAQQLFDMLSAANSELWPGCKNHSVLSVVARLLHMKAEHHFSERCYDDFVQLAKEMLPEGHSMVDNFYRTKKISSGIGTTRRKD